MASLLEGIGNALSLPGSMVRDALTLNNPLDQLLTPFSGDNRTTPQDLLHKMGVEGDSPWLSFGVDMATDPLNLIGAGLFSGAGRSLAKGIKGAGLVGKAKGGLQSLGKALSSPEEFAKAKNYWWPAKAATGAVDDVAKVADNVAAPIVQATPQAGYGGMGAMMNAAPVGPQAGYGGFSSFMPPVQSAAQALPEVAQAATAVAPEAATGFKAALQRAFFDPNYRNMAKGFAKQGAMNEGYAQDAYNRQMAAMPQMPMQGTY